jgi:hypothetical protein
MAFKTSQVRSTEPVPVHLIEQLSESGFSAKLDGIGVVSVERKASLAKHVKLTIQQDGDGSSFQERVITASFGTLSGERGLKQATVETVDILGRHTTLYFKERPELQDPRKELRDFKDTFLRGSPLATVVRALYHAWVTSGTSRLQSQTDEPTPASRPDE